MAARPKAARDGGRAPEPKRLRIPHQQLPLLYLCSSPFLCVCVRERARLQARARARACACTCARICARTRACGGVVCSNAHAPSRECCCYGRAPLCAEPSTPHNCSAMQALLRAALERPRATKAHNWRTIRGSSICGSMSSCTYVGVIAMFTCSHVHADCHRDPVAFAFNSVWVSSVALWSVVLLLCPRMPASSFNKVWL